MTASPQIIVRSQSTALRLTEIFHSLQGESRTVGCPTVFVRLTGCPLRCTWCDTAYAFQGGTLTELSDILATVASYHTRHVTVTGGEPLAQPACHTLLTALCDAGFDVSLETSGALSTAEVDPRVSVVLDLKAPGSGESDRNDYSNVSRLRPHDQVKFVLADRQDYEWAVAKTSAHDLVQRVSDVLFSPVHDQLAPRELAEWILADRLTVRFQLQLHKLLWPHETGR